MATYPNTGTDPDEKTLTAASLTIPRCPAQASVVRPSAAYSDIERGDAVCEFSRWAATGIMIDMGTFADLSAEEGTTRSRPTMMLTVVGGGTCPGPGWFHSLVRTEDLSGRAEIAVFCLTTAGPSDVPHPPTEPATALVDWTGPISPDTARVEVLEADPDGGSVVVDVDVRW
jgi:hypothetical protein